MPKYYDQDCRERCVAKLEKTLPESGNILSKMKQYFDKQFQCIQKELPQQQKSLKRKLHRILRRHCVTSNTSSNRNKYISKILNVFKFTNDTEKLSNLNMEKPWALDTEKKHPNKENGTPMIIKLTILSKRSFRKQMKTIGEALLKFYEKWNLLIHNTFK